MEDKASILRFSQSGNLHDHRMGRYPWVIKELDTDPLQETPAHGGSSQVFIAITSKKLIINYGLAVAARQSPRGDYRHDSSSAHVASLSSSDCRARGRPTRVWNDCMNNSPKTHSKVDGLAPWPYKRSKQREGLPPPPSSAIAPFSQATACTLHSISTPKTACSWEPGTTGDWLSWNASPPGP